MRVIAEPAKGGDIKPGELFSAAGPDYWNNVGHVGSIGERVFIRTNQPLPDGEADADTYRITIVQEEANDGETRP